MLSIYARTRFRAQHSWPNAPEEVSFLRDLHRHEFHVKAEVSVKHPDRDVEFFTLQKHLDTICQALFAGKELQGISCEMMAQSISIQLEKINYLPIEIEVSEDGENGAYYRKEC